MKRLALLAVVAAGACTKPASAPPPKPPPAADAGPVAVATDPALLDQRAKLLDACRAAAWAEHTDAQAAIDRCDAADKAASTPVTKALVARAAGFRTAALLVRKNEDDSQRASELITKKDGAGAYRLLNSCCRNDKQRLEKAEELAGAQCLAQAKQPQPDAAPCFIWFNAHCAKLPAATFTPPPGRTKGWHSPEPHVALIVDATGKAPECRALHPLGDALVEPDHLPEQWARSWYEHDDAASALQRYLLDGTLPAPGSLKSDPELDQRFTQLAALEKTNTVESLDQAFALDARLVAAPGGAIVPTPPQLSKGPHLKPLQALYSAAAETSATALQKSGDLAGACKLWWHRLELCGPPGAARPLDKDCDAEAKKRLARAKGCDALAEALAFARPGSPVAGQVEHKRAASHCP